MTDAVQETPVEETAASTSTEAPAATEPAKSRSRGNAKGNRKGKAQAKARPAPAKAKARARQPIPEGMTRSRGALIPAANGRLCQLVGTGGVQCKNPGRWPAKIDGQSVVTCTTHKRSAKQVVFAPKTKARRSRKASTSQAAASA